MRDGKHLILIIDDDPDYRQAVRVILEASDYVVEESGSAREGIRALDTVKPDLIIVDLMMEEVDSGEHFIKELKAQQAGVPVYLSSSVGDQFHMSTDYRALGLDGILQKPLDPDRLLEMLKQRLSAAESS